MSGCAQLLSHVKLSLLVPLCKLCVDDPVHLRVWRTRRPPEIRAVIFSLHTTSYPWAPGLWAAIMWGRQVPRTWAMWCSHRLCGGTHSPQLVPQREHRKNLAEISLISMVAGGKWIKLVPSVGGGMWGCREFNYTAAFRVDDKGPLKGPSLSKGHFTSTTASLQSNVSGKNFI